MKRVSALTALLILVAAWPSELLASKTYVPGRADTAWVDSAKTFYADADGHVVFAAGSTANMAKVTIDTCTIDSAAIDTAAITYLTVTTMAGTPAFGDGTSAAPSITNSGDTNTGLYFPAADQVGITLGGTKAGLWSGDDLTVTGDVSATDLDGILGSNTAAAASVTTLASSGKYTASGEIESNGTLDVNGPMTIALAPVFSGGATFNDATFTTVDIDDGTVDGLSNLSVDDYLEHAGDADTYFGYDAADAAILLVGNETFIDVTEDDSQDKIVFGDQGDIDFVVDCGAANALVVHGEDGNVCVRGTVADWDPTFKVLQLSTRAAVATQDGGTYLMYNAMYDDTDNTWEYMANDTYAMFQMYGNAFYWYQGASGSAGDAATNINAGTAAMTLDAPGNVGIGATPHGTNSGYTAAYLGGNAGWTSVTAAGAGNGSYFGVNTHLDTDGSWEYISTDEAALYYMQNGTCVWQVAGSGTAGDDISFTTALTIANAGAVKNPVDSQGFYTGAGDDLRMYHDGTNSYITNSTNWVMVGNGGSGVQLNGTVVSMNNAAGTEAMFVASADGAVTLYYDNASKLATNATGIITPAISIGSTAGDHDLEITTGSTYSELDAGEAQFTVSCDTSLKTALTPVLPTRALVDVIADSVVVRRWQWKREALRSQSTVDRLWTDSTRVPDAVAAEVARREAVVVDSTAQVSTWQDTSMVASGDSVLVDSAWISLTDTLVTTHRDTTWVPVTYVVDKAEEAAIEDSVRTRVHAACQVQVDAYEAGIDKRAAQQHVGLTADQAIRISRLVAPDDAVEGQVNGNHVQAGLVLALQAEIARGDSLEAVVTALQDRVDTMQADFERRIAALEAAR